MERRMVSSSKKLTKEAVDRATPKGKRYEIWDDALSGLGLRVEPTGTKSFIFRYRPAGTGRDGVKRFLKIGRYGSLTPDQARNKAKELLGLVASGEDPAAVLAEARDAAKVADLAAAYLDEVRAKRKPATAGLYRDYLNRLILPEIGRLKAASVTRAMVAKVHVKIGKRHPVTANRVLACVSSMFAFGEKRDLLPPSHVNPAGGMIEKFPETARERYLSTDELERLGAAIREAETTGVPWDVDGTKPTAKHVPKTNRQTAISPFAAAALRLLLFSGCRLGEILNLR
jgi:hypothetical protein